MIDWKIARAPKPLLSYEPFARMGAVNGVTMRAESDEESNFSFSVTQHPEAVRNARHAACKRLGFTMADLVVPLQTHGANVTLVGAAERGQGALSPEKAIPDCDALITDTPGVLLGITVADCLPVFLFDPQQRALGLAHSGWRGTAGRIVPRTLAAMTEAFGTQPKNVRVAIGPRISGSGYEVDENVRANFDSHVADAPGVFIATRPGHWRLDLTAAVCQQLKTVGVAEENIACSPYHTDRHPEHFYSHRAAPGCPRMMALFGLTDR